MQMLLRCSSDHCRPGWGSSWARFKSTKWLMMNHSYAGITRPRPEWTSDEQQAGSSKRQQIEVKVSIVDTADESGA